MRKFLRENRVYLQPRKYVGARERKLFFEATRKLKPKRQVFCQIIYYTGCRIQEAHELCPFDFDLTNGIISFECLKQRQDGIFRDISVPIDWLVHAAKILGLDRLEPFECAWDFSLKTGYRSVKKAMELAGIDETYANSRGLRHSFCTLHGAEKTDLKQIQKWAGHKKPETTLIYMDAVTENEREAAKRLW
jgi:integrase